MTTARPSEARPSFWIAAVLLGIAAATAFHLAPSLPFNVAFDEPLKVGFVLKGPPISGRDCARRSRSQALPERSLSLCSGGRARRRCGGCSFSPSFGTCCTSCRP
jgi:hypothetical protein